ncbi:hypothetical protein CN198_18975 [Sinorhizobium meliloti]|uniref:hypothetical protein n=1 Tax=Rhizobium meliloti TaxID=382 RepID=UPI000FDBD918|nr:hypothetical protein [Sinorhizobium meliloti]MDW9500286.1 hypothetical protein [Sinorhizobium meliloti]MDX0014819.1 hypothetical protein [Sinorhizobium meliloti]MDX0026897.1 hypothetical protein [Sinorhizobium meliloti]MDX0070387.1 hypothetical protein [Sinorhizobium meliloti]MDX0304151.1 hypothetical protein [Sinorhizobium meliloti]
MMVGFEEMVLKCPEGDARTYVRDAIRCYESGAYRAAIVSAYVAVCFDLIEKLRILASAGDAAATVETEALSNLQTRHERDDQAAIGGLLVFERSLLELFRDKFDFFGIDEFEQLSRLRFDRNRCAHPSFTRANEPFQPTAELARLHIRNAIEYVVSQPPKQGKAALAGLQATVLAPYFPSKTPEIVARLKGSGLGNARPSLTKAFIDELAFGFATKGNPYYSKLAIPPVISAVIEIDRVNALQRAIQNTQKILANPDKDAVRMGAALVVWISEVAEALDSASKATMSTWLAKNEEESLAGIVRRALRISWLKDDAVKSIPRLTREQMGRISGDLPTELLEHAATLFSTSPNWDTANSFAAKVAIPYAANFRASDIDMIFRNAREGKGDLRGSHGFTDFVEALYNVSPLGAAAISALLEQHGHEDYKR